MNITKLHFVSREGLKPFVVIVFAFLYLQSCTPAAEEAAIPESETEKTGGTSVTEKSAFEQGQTSTTVTGASLADFDYECSAERYDENLNSEIVCVLKKKTTTSALAVTEVEENIVVSSECTIEANVNRLFGTVNGSSQLVVDPVTGKITVTFPSDVNNATKFTLNASATCGSQTMQVAESKIVAFENECDGLPSTSDFQAFGEGTVVFPYLFCYSSQFTDYASKTRQVQFRSALGSHIRIGRNLLELGDSEMIGYLNYPFTGVFQGNGYSLESLSYTGATEGDETAMFLYTSNATIEDFTIENVYIESNYNAAALIQYASATAIRRVHILAGEFLRSGGFTLNVNSVAGLVSHLTNGSIVEKSSVRNFRFNANYTGGIAVRVDATSSIVESYAEISEPRSDLLGGLVVRLFGEIKDSYAKITDHVPVTGIFGTWVGGLVYENSNGKISSSYAVMNSTATNQGGIFLNGTCGQCQNTYWDVTTSGITNAFLNSNGNATGMTGLTTAQLKTQSFLQGFDFQAWWQIMSGAYPSLIHNSN